MSAGNILCLLKLAVIVDQNQSGTYETNRVLLSLEKREEIFARSRCIGNVERVLW